MMKPNLDDMHHVIAIAKKAGETIMQIYQKDLVLRLKKTRAR